MTTTRVRTAALSVSPETITEERTRGWKNFGPEDYCHRCGTRNLHAWSVGSAYWNVAVPEIEGVLCPQCFAEAYERATGDNPCWDLVPYESPPEDLREAVARIVRDAPDHLDPLSDWFIGELARVCERWAEARG